jgi:hypothetical protein
MDEGRLVWLGLGSLIVLVGYLSLSQRQRNAIADRLFLRGRRISSAKTPPRSLSPSEKGSAPSAARVNEYASAFPPSQRHVLNDIKKTLSGTQRHQLGSLDFDEKAFENNLIGWEEDYFTCDESKYVASGFSVKEIRALGNFPDYAALTGVPDPQPYVNFDITQAIPRPYRPFRWAYHQTMCKRPDGRLILTR